MVPESESIMVGSMAAGDWNRRLRDHIVNHTNTTTQRE